MTLEEAAKKMQEYGYDGVDWRVTDISDRSRDFKEEPSLWKNNYCTVDINKVEGSGRRDQGTFLTSMVWRSTR